MTIDKITSKNLNEEDDGDILFKTPRVVAVGISSNGQPFKVTSTVDYAALLTAKRHAELQAMAVAQAAEEALMEVAQTGVDTSHDFELAFMDEALNALRSGLVEPITRLTDKQMAELEADRPGIEEFENRWIL